MLLCVCLLAVASALRGDYGREIRTLDPADSQTLLFHGINEGWGAADVAAGVLEAHADSLDAAAREDLRAQLLSWASTLEEPPLHQGELLFHVPVLGLPAPGLAVHAGDNAAQLARVTLRRLGMGRLGRDTLVELLHGRIVAHEALRCGGGLACRRAACHRHINTYPGYELGVRPPDATKRSVLRSLRHRFDLLGCIETGTLYGDTTADLAQHCANVTTIELQPAMAEAARQRFEGPEFEHVQVIHGDSGRELARAPLMRSAAPLLFYLDGHYSQADTAAGDEHSPIMKELRTVAARARGGDVVVIDDMDAFRGDRMFVGLHYPELATVQRLVCDEFPPETLFDVEENMGRLYRPAVPVLL